MMYTRFINTFKISLSTFSSYFGYFLFFSFNGLQGCCLFMSFPLEDTPFFGLLLVLVIGAGTDGGAVGLMVEDDEAMLEDVAGMLDLLISGKFFFDRFCCGVLLDGGLGRFFKFLLRSETSQRSSSIVDSIILGMFGTMVMYSG